MYQNWVPTIDCPTIQSQVIKDLREVLGSSKEVLDRLAGRDSSEIVYKILRGYEGYVTTEYRREIIQSISRNVAEAGAQALAPVLEKWLDNMVFGPATVLRNVLPAPLPQSVSRVQPQRAKKFKKGGEKMTRKNDKTCICFVLDESGSMMSCRDQTISGFNEFMDSQEDKTLGETRVTLVKFNSDKIDTVYADKLIEDTPKLTEASYQPYATTPLYDAIAQAIKTTEDQVDIASRVLSKLAGHSVVAGPLVIVVIMTDGLENASRQYKQPDIFDMIQKKKDVGWTFVFLGADQDSWAAGGAMGIPMGSTVNYDRAQTVRAFQGISQSMSRYRTSYFAAAQNLVAADDIGDQEAVAKTVNELKKLRENYWQGKKEV